MPVRIGICDGSTENIRLLSEALYAFDPFFQISSFTDGKSLLADLAEQKVPFDIIFLDIYMPDFSGLELAGKIRKENSATRIIFISSINDSAPEAYNVFAFNYLQKPLNLTNFNRLLSMALVGVAEERRRQISFRYNSINYRVFCRDIKYMESRNKNVNFYMANQEMYQCSSSLDDVLIQMLDGVFIRCHQRFAVNVYHITGMADNHFCIGTAMIGISRKYLKSSKEQYFNFMINNMNSIRLAGSAY